MKLWRPPAQERDLRELSDGEYIYRLGDHADAIFSVISGFVIVKRPSPGGGSREQLIGPGAVFGAADVLSRTLRSATAQAHGPAVVAMHIPEEVLNAIMDRPEAADAMVASLLVARRREEIERSQALAVIAPKSVRLVPREQSVIDQLGAAPLVIEEFPFVIGRAGDSSRTGVELKVSLTLVDRSPFHLSRRHFAIDHRDGHYVVQDCRSYHGTIVNGQPLGAGTATYQAQLAPGENEIVAGSEDSPFRFTCIVPITPSA